MTDDINPRAVIGANRPPVPKPADAEAIHLDLSERYADEERRFQDIIAAAQRAPVKITDDVTCAKVQDLVKQIRVLDGALESAREIEGEPYKAARSAVDGYFKTRGDQLSESKKKTGFKEVLGARITEYLEEKAAKEKKRLAEEAEARRVAEQAAIEAARVAEEAKRKAEAEKAKAEEDARRAEEAKRKAIEEERLAKERAEQAKRDEIRLAAERLQREREADERRKRQEEEDAAAAAKREEQRIANETAAAEAKAKRIEEEAKAAAAREATVKAREEQRIAEEGARAANADAKAAGRDEKAAMSLAEREDKRASRIEDRIDGPESALASTRSELGSLGTLGRAWKWKVIDRDLLDRNALWPFLHTEDIEVALGKWFRTQDPETAKMPGASFEQETTGQVR